MPSVDGILPASTVATAVPFTEHVATPPFTVHMISFVAPSGPSGFAAGLMFYGRLPPKSVVARALPLNCRTSTPPLV